ncbi:MAG: CBS domain-containing protein [Nitrosopumilus sp.]|nr:CBS domain-containing protein [Nitrosopumilus sp.]
MSNSEKSLIPINKFMTRKIKSIQGIASVIEAAKMMYENHIPSLIVKEGEKIAGIVSHVDIAIALTVYGKKPESNIRDIMSSPVISVKSDSSILNAIELMLERKIHELPVIDNEKIQGIISASDLITLLSMLTEKQFHEVFRIHLSE